MSGLAMDISGQLRRVVIAQALVAVVLGCGLFIAYDLPHGKAAVYGVLVGMALTLLLGRSVRRAGEVAATDPKRGMTLLYVGAVVRFVFVIAALALGLAIFRLNPLLVAVGFVAAQLAQLVNARGTTQDTESEGLK